MFRTLALTSLLTFFGATDPGPPAAASGPTDATVFVVHGIPGIDLMLDPTLPVDVSVNGGCALQGLTFGEVIGPLHLPAGSTTVEVRAADPVNPCGNPVLFSATVTLVAGENATIIAHLNDSGTPVASKFVNDVSPVPTGQARVIPHHTANAPDVDIFLQKYRFLTPLVPILGFQPGQQVAALFDEGPWRLWIRPAGSQPNVLGPIIPFFRPRGVYSVYAVGTPANNTFTLIVLEQAAG